MLKHITAALAALFLLLPGSVFAESLDLSKLGDIEEAEQWEERTWYQREDGSDRYCHDFRDRRCNHRWRHTQERQEHLR